MRDQKISSQMIRLAYQNRIQSKGPTSPAPNSAIQTGPQTATSQNSGH